MTFTPTPGNLQRVDVTLSDGRKLQWSRLHGLIGDDLIGMNMDDIHDVMTSARAYWSTLDRQRRQRARNYIPQNSVCIGRGMEACAC